MIGIFPKEKCIVVEEAPEPAPGSKTGDVIENIEEAALFDCTSGPALHRHRQSFTKGRTKRNTILQHNFRMIVNHLCMNPSEQTD